MYTRTLKAAYSPLPIIYLLFTLNTDYFALVIYLMPEYFQCKPVLRQVIFSKNPPVSKTTVIQSF